MIFTAVTLGCEKPTTSNPSEKERNGTTLLAFDFNKIPTISLGRRERRDLGDISFYNRSSYNDLNISEIDVNRVASLCGVNQVLGRLNFIFDNFVYQPNSEGHLERVPSRTMPQEDPITTFIALESTDNEARAQLERFYVIPADQASRAKNIFNSILLSLLFTKGVCDSVSAGLPEVGLPSLLRTAEIESRKGLVQSYSAHLAAGRIPPVIIVISDTIS